MLTSQRITLKKKYISKTIMTQEPAATLSKGARSELLHGITHGQVTKMLWIRNVLVMWH